MNRLPTTPYLRLLPLAVGAMGALACTEATPSTTEDACTPGVSCATTAPVGSNEGGAGDGGAIVRVDGGAVATKSDLPCDVKAIVAANCAVCHSAGGAAPMPLLTSADFLASAPTAPGKSVAQSVTERVHATDTKVAMPPAGYPKLSEGDLATLDAWIARGTPASTAACTTEFMEDAGTPTQPETDDLECFTFKAHDPAGKDVKYKVGLALDVYLNMTFVPPWPDTRYAVSIKPITDNKKVIHHWLLFQNSTPGVDGAISPALGAHPDGQLVTAWAPGGTGLDLTNVPDTGYAMPGGPNVSYNMEFHYNSSDPAAEDASGVEICMFKKKPTNTTSVSWLGKDNLGVPEKQWVATCAPIYDKPIHIVSVMPHMHKYGIHFKSIINRKDGSKETLHDADFNFEYQLNYPKDVTLMPGESITTTCDYSQPANFGKSTDAEMCYLFTYAYPAGALTQLDPWGLFAHGGSSCLQ